LTVVVNVAFDVRSVPTLETDVASDCEAVNELQAARRACGLWLAEPIAPAVVNMCVRLTFAGLVTLLSWNRPVGVSVYSLAKTA